MIAGSLGAQSSPAARLARTKAASDRIRAEDILRDVSYLASDANMGRRTPFPGLASPGYDSAAAYVARFPRRHAREADGRQRHVLSNTTPSLARRSIRRKSAERSATSRSSGARIF
jgi:hypothetical protein